MALVKLTSKNQISLPKALLAKLPATRYFDIVVEGGRLVLKPVKVTELNAEGEQARRRLADIVGIGPQTFQTAGEVDAHVERLRSEWRE